VNVTEEKRWMQLWWGVTRLDQYESFVKEAKRQDVPDIMEPTTKTSFVHHISSESNSSIFISLLRMSWVCAEEEAAEEAVVDLSSRIVRI
jgi:hypothetical protein